MGQFFTPFSKGKGFGVVVIPTIPKTQSIKPLLGSWEFCGFESDWGNRCKWCKDCVDQPGGTPGSWCTIAEVGFGLEVDTTELNTPKKNLVLLLFCKKNFNY